jgi:DNA-binding NtrC family response regulator
VSDATRDVKLVKGQGHILMVDDEVSITNLGKRILEKYGYTVTTANNPKDAIDLFSKNAKQFDVVVTDLTMPDMKGDRLITEIQKIRAGTPCILCTGYSREITVKTDSIDGLKDVLIKPLRQKEFVSAIQHVLNKGVGFDE